jgi:hypothetical protein
LRSPKQSACTNNWPIAGEIWLSKQCAMDDERRPPSGAAEREDGGRWQLLVLQRSPQRRATVSARGQMESRLGYRRPAIDRVSAKARRPHAAGVVQW